MSPWQNPQRCTRKGRGRAVALQGRGAVQESLPDHEVRTILRLQSIVCATWRATFRARTQAGDKSPNHLVPTNHFLSGRQVACNARKTRRRTQPTKTTMAPSDAPPEKAVERSNRIGS